MNPLIISAGIGAAGGLVGGLLGNKASADEAARNREWQRKMFQRRYQYTVEDMRKAGLNPALAYQQGGGSTPSGSTAQQDDPVRGGIEGASRGISSALAMRQNAAQIENIKAQTELTRAQASQLRAESGPRAEWWSMRPEQVRMGITEAGGRWRVQNMVHEFLESTLKDRVAIVGLERQEMQEILTQLRQEIELRGLERAPLEVQSKFAQTWYGQNVAPYVSSAGGISGIVSGVLSPFLKWMNSRSGPNNGPSRMKPDFKNRRTW